MKCYTCFHPEHLCLCPQIKPFETRAKIVILIHPMEAKKEKLGTGRITKACIIDSELIMGIDFTEDKRVNDLISDERYLPLVLYPGAGAISATNPSESDFKVLKEKIPLIFVIDGTWPCAKKMMKLSSNINTLSRISFETDRVSKFLIKSQPDLKALSTIESIHVLLDDLERNGLEKLARKHDALIDVFTYMIQRQIKIASDPNRPRDRRGRGIDPNRSETTITPKKNRSFILL